MASTARKNGASPPRKKPARVYLRIAFDNREKARLFFKNAPFQLLWDTEMRLWYVNTGLEELKVYRAVWKESPYRDSFKIAFR